MNAEYIAEFKLDNGVTVRIQNEPNYDLIKQGAEAFFKSYLASVNKA